MIDIYKVANWYFSKTARPAWYVMLFDCFIVLFSAFLCYALVHGGYFTLRHFNSWLLTWGCYLCVFILYFRLFRTYAGILRYSTFTDLCRVAGANILAVCTIEAVRIFLNVDDYLEPVRFLELFIIFLMVTVGMCGARISVKYIYERIQVSSAHRKVFIYGVKTGGIAMAKSIRSSVPTRFVLKGFVSDADDLVGHRLQGVPVYKNDETLIENIKKSDVTAVLVSPLKRKRLSENEAMVNSLIDAGILIFVYDQAKEWDGHSDIAQNQLQEVQIEDLLPRDEIQVDLDAVEKLLKGKKVLITGSAGSIGSEMVRQVAQFCPDHLILIDSAETPQHDIRLMMARDFPHVPAETIVTTITDAQRMESIFKTYRPDFVFHAAAYKHVPMMEDNPSEAVRNNILGTRTIADLAVKYGVKKFVMISTDKAVNPTNVMGCSKRICEIYCQALNNAIVAKQIEGETQFVTTRFGNVLGSNGSVIPLFREQIKKGGPVTVTHPDIIRFFMLIPEACKLVLEAGTMGKGGEIFVFDMGKPVKIADLAARMIKLSGATNVEVKFTGLRDGEKLYEEVLNDQEMTKPTFNKKIKIAQVREYDYAGASSAIQELIDKSKQFDDMETVRLMKQIVPEYKSQHSKYESLDK